MNLRHTNLFRASFFVWLLMFCACNKKAEIQVQNRFSKISLENVYWGDVYLGGNLKPGEDTDFKRIHRADAPLPEVHELRFKVDKPDTLIGFYTAEQFELLKGEQLIIILHDSLMLFEDETLR